MMMLSDMDFMLILPELFLSCAILMLLIIGVFRGDAHADKLAYLAVVSLIITGALVYDGRMSTGVAFNGMFLSSLFTIMMKLLVLGASVIVLFMTVPVIRQSMGQFRFEYPILVMLATLGMMLMVSANNLIMLYMGLELASLAFYVMAAIDRDDDRSNEAGIKYFVLGAVASGMLLYGCSLVYGFTGSVQFDDLAIFLAGGSLSTGVALGLVFLLVGLCFKISAVPFHMWTPDVYEGSPTYVTAFFASASKVAALALLIRVLLEPFGVMVLQWQQIIVFVSVASMVVGAFAAIRQHNIKRMLAYSSIGHVGYALMGIAAYSVDGIQAVVIYLSLYLVMSLGAFACVLFMQRKGVMVEDIYELRGLSRTHPKIALAMGIFMFSMTGIPPLAGFFGKFMVFFAVVDAGLIWLAIIGVLSSVVAAFYYLRVVKVMYLDEVEAPLDTEISPETRVVIGATSLFTLLFFLYPTPLYDVALRAAESIGVF